MCVPLIPKSFTLIVSEVSQFTASMTLILYIPALNLEAVLEEETRVASSFLISYLYGFCPPVAVSFNFPLSKPQVAGYWVPEIFKEDGEKHFRELELVALATKTKENCQVIATGGGSVTLNNAHFLMAQNSKVVYIKRDFSLASTKDRPLLKDPNAMQTLYEKRRHLYEQMADLTVYNNGSVESVVEEIVLRMRNYWTALAVLR